MKLQESRIWDDKKEKKSFLNKDSSSFTWSDAVKESWANTYETKLLASFDMSSLAVTLLDTGKGETY